MTGPTTTRFLCPVDDCDWTHDEAVDLPDDATAQDVQDVLGLRQQAVETLLIDHFETHSTQEWAQTVSNLRTQLAAQPQPLLCLACVVAAHNAQRIDPDFGVKPYTPNPAVVIAKGSGICLEHLQIADGPVMGDRTAGGIVLPGNASRLNGGAN